MAQKKTMQTIKVKCMQANKNQRGSQIVFAAETKETEKGLAAKTAVSIMVADNAANMYETGKDYVITVTEA
jgi:hypothetical protein